MPDEPKISKHHAGQHPTLKSFRAFDIIPPSKVKPQHTARPVITSQVKHFDTTLTPPKADEPKPGATEAEASKPDDTSMPPVAAATPTEATSQTQPEASTPELTPEPTTPEAITPTDTTPEVTTDTVSEPAPTPEAEKPAEPSPETNQPELAAVPESVPKPAPSAEAASDGDLNSILDQEAGPQTQLNHSQEFKNVLKEFTAQSQNEASDKPVVAVHQHDYLRVVMQVLMWLVIVAVVAALIVDILLDTGALTLTYNIPHTHFFSH